MPFSDQSQRSVLITGASTGIGAATALHLDQMGFRVFAGIRRPEDGKALQQKASNRLKPVFLDVTDQHSIEAAVQNITIEAGENGLTGLVNNAGIAIASPLEFVPLERLRTQFEVNVIGQVAVIQAFLPLLRKAKGRIINISSVSGKIASPYVSPYCASKFALEALSDSLRVELKPWGIEVIVIEPGVTDTPIWQKSLATSDGILKDSPAEAKVLYGKAVEAMQTFARNAKGFPAEGVAKVIAQALISSRPKTRYQPGLEARIGVWVAGLPDRLRDWLLMQRLKKFNSQ